MHERATILRWTRELIRPLPEADQLALLNAFLDYQLYGAVPELSVTNQVIFAAVKPALDNSVSSIERGAKGGRPTKTKPAQNLPTTCPESADNPAMTCSESADNPAITCPKPTDNPTITYPEPTDTLSITYPKPTDILQETYSRIDDTRIRDIRVRDIRVKDKYTYNSTEDIGGYTNGGVGENTTAPDGATSAAAPHFTTPVVPQALLDYDGITTDSGDAGTVTADTGTVVADTVVAAIDNPVAPITAVTPEPAPPVGTTAPAAKPKRSRSKPSAEKKHPYGDEFGCVRLTQEQEAKLVERFGAIGATDWIDRLDVYLASHGDKYKDHYATIISWARNDDRQQQAKPSPRASPRASPLPFPKGKYTLPDGRTTDNYPLWLSMREGANDKRANG
jgi:hypothetical protein